ncbi:MAG TPA: phenylalanine--tRNA ligase subunit beta, partial [Actinomycetota bacterium]|nr:phenylalanine--tRNA ligase subunit beta [Actinomycetota bacterium]
RKGEKILTLDGQERALTKADVLICDAERPVAIAGIMGGSETEVSETTTRILLESAYFSPERIAHTARRLGMRTEASVRFEHGTDVENVSPAAARAAGLLASLAGGTVARGAIDEYPKVIARKAIRVRVARANAMLGTDVSSSEMTGLLSALGCHVEASRSTLRVTPPSWRPDIVIEENVVEEIGRLYGYENIPETLPRGGRVGGLNLHQRQRRVARQVLLGAGLSEAQTLSLLPPWFADRAGLADEHPLRGKLRLSNPLSEDELVLRPSLIPGLLLAAQRNVARSVLPVLLFEMGSVFAPGDAATVAERERLAFVLAGPTPPDPYAPSRELDFSDGKGVLETLAAGLGVGSISLNESDGDGVGHPGRSATVEIGDVHAGALMELHPSISEALDLPRRVIVCELDVLTLFGAVSESVAAAPPRFPGIGRDVALIVPDGTRIGDVEDRIRSVGGDRLVDIRLFDVYRGEQIPAGTTSLAFTLSLRDPERTLTDADADAVMDAIGRAASEAGWTIRT